MNLKEMYEYAYYEVYKSMTLSTDWGADWRASGVLIAFEEIFLFSFICLFRFLFPYSVPTRFGYEWALVPFAALFIIDYYVFHSKGQWKDIIQKYDAWPRKKKFMGTCIVWGIISLLLAYSFYIFKLYSVVDWTQYGGNG